MTVQPIQTRYAGRHFRSRLEARWAVLFESLDLQWEYEAQGYETPAGRWLPDFMLHLDQPVLFEVKPDSAKVHLPAVDPRWVHVGSQLDIPVFVAYGVPRPEDPLGLRTDGTIWQVSPYVGPHIGFTRCDRCKAVGLTYMGRGTHHATCLSGPDDPFVLQAIRRALSARFEHGESGA